MKDRTMSGISNEFIAGRMLQRLRCLAALLLVCLGLGATSSYAQSTPTCTAITAGNLTSMKPTVSYSTFTSLKSLDKFSRTVTLSGCSGFTVNRFDVAIDNPVSVKFNTTVNNGGVVGLQRWRSFASCNNALFVLNACTDANGQVLSANSNPTSGFRYDISVNFLGTTSLGEPCGTATGGNPDDFVSPFQRFRLSIIFRNCSTFIIQFDVEVFQNADPIFTNTLGVPTLAAKIVQGNRTSGLFFLKFPNNPIPLLANSNITLIPAVSTYISNAGTCSVSLSPTTINMGSLSPDALLNKVKNDVVVSKPLNVSIGNCPTLSNGKNKTLKWTFIKPRSDDVTLMENTAVEGAATGISAQIQADARRSVVNSTLLSSIVPSGEWYITSGLSSNNQSLSYKVNLIVNGDTVSPGNFGTSAVVTVSYL
jgi:hypothetical protein